MTTRDCADRNRDFRDEPILAGAVSTEAYALRSSRRSADAKVDVWSAGKLAARATTTYMIQPMAEMRAR